MSADYAALVMALRDAYAKAGSLRALRREMLMKIGREPFSIAEWGRVLRGDMTMDFRHGMQVAALVGETIEIPPVLFEAMAENNDPPVLEYAVHLCTSTLEAICTGEGTSRSESAIVPKSAPGGSLRAMRKVLSFAACVA